jgi:hypothetical protein
MGEGRWGPMTAWHHLECVAPRCSTGADVEGYGDLPEEHQQALSERVTASKGELDELYEVL